MKKVLVAGKFDLLHPGHLNFFENAKKHGDHLTVVIARDETILKNKGTYPDYSEETRKQFILALKIVDEALLGNYGNEMEILKIIMPDVICLGYDQEIPEERIEIYCAKHNIKRPTLIRLAPYKETIFKSSLLKENLRQ
jgi:FAD synthetase